MPPMRKVDTPQYILHEGDLEVIGSGFLWINNLVDEQTDADERMPTHLEGADTFQIVPFSSSAVALTRSWS